MAADNAMATATEDKGDAEDAFSGITFGGAEDTATAVQSAPAVGAVDADAVVETGKTEAKVTPMKTAFLDALPKGKQAEFAETAKGQFQAFVKDQSTISEFGKESVEKVNSVVDQIIDTQKNVRIPEVDDLLEQANRDLDGFVAKYSDEVKEIKEPSKLFKWFRKTKRKAEDAAFDRKNLADRLDVIDGKVIAKREELKESFHLIDQLLKANKESTNAMVGVLAALEAVYIVAVNEADRLKTVKAGLQPNTPEWQEASDKLADTAEVANAIEAQHANYMARLAVAWATNSQVRNLQRVQTTVVRNLSMVHQQTVPIMKLAIAQVGMGEKAREGHKTSEATKTATSHALAKWREMAAEQLPEIEKAAQSPVVSADDISKLTDSVEDANKKIVDAINSGRAARQALEEAVRDAGKRIKESDSVRDDALVDALLNENQQKQRDAAATKEFEEAAADAYHGTGV